MPSRKLIELAESNNLKLTAGHNAQFTHAMIRMRELVQNGYLGGKPIHLRAITAMTSVMRLMPKHCWKTVIIG
jgi:predicted dehydrogenase